MREKAKIFSDVCRLFFYLFYCSLISFAFTATFVWCELALEPAKYRKLVDSTFWMTYLIVVPDRLVSFWIHIVRVPPPWRPVFLGMNPRFFRSSRDSLPMKSVSFFILTKKFNPASRGLLSRVIWRKQDKNNSVDKSLCAIKVPVLWKGLTFTKRIGFDLYCSVYHTVISDTTLNLWGVRCRWRFLWTRLHAVEHWTLRVYGRKRQVASEWWGIRRKQ